MKHVKRFEDEKLNEDHLKYRDQQIKFIESRLNLMKDEDIKTVYELVEKLSMFSDDPRK